MRRPLRAARTLKSRQYRRLATPAGGRQQESNRRFVRGFRRDYVPLSSAAVGDDEHRWLVAAIRTTPTRGQATRARLLVALAAFLSGRDVTFVNFDWSDEVQ